MRNYFFATALLAAAINLPVQGYDGTQPQSQTQRYIDINGIRNCPAAGYTPYNYPREYPYPKKWHRFEEEYNRRNGIKDSKDAASAVYAQQADTQHGYADSQNAVNDAERILNTKSVLKPADKPAKKPSKPFIFPR